MSQPEEKNPPKRGSWSVEEKLFIRQNINSMSIKDIAKHLGRKYETTYDWIKRNIASTEAVAKVGRESRMNDERKNVLETFRESLGYQKLHAQFDTEEIAYFEEEYLDIYMQFKEDVFKTEQQQILKAITFQILMQRNMAERKKLLTNIARLDQWQARASKDYEKERASLSDSERQAKEEFLLNLESQLAGLRSAEQSKTREFSDLDTRHQKLMEALKATREQRINQVESGKQTYMGILRELADEERREALGHQVVLMADATKKEYERLASPYKYDDGNEDLPILSAETVEMLDSKQEETDDEEDDDE